MESVINCPLCNNSTYNDFIIKEMMFGTFRNYHYCECKVCGILWENEKSSELNDLDIYSENYYSFNQVILPTEIFFLHFLKKRRMKFYLWKNDLLGLLISKIKPIKDPNFYHRWLKSKTLNYNSKILDVGCGCGALLFYLRHIGFTNLYGVDPFIPKSLSEKYITIYKNTIFEIKGIYDLIMFHHSLEHLNNPLEVLDKAKHLLREDGRIIIRIPLKDSYAWDNYGINWVQLDAPRHKIIYSLKGFELLCEKVNLKIIDKYYDSTAFQFWGSELYCKNIPLYANVPGKSYFNKSEIDEFEKQAQELNVKELGDQIVFTLKRNI